MAGGGRKENTISYEEFYIVPGNKKISAYSMQNAPSYVLSSTVKTIEYSPHSSSPRGTVSKDTDALCPEKTVAPSVSEMIS